MKTNYVATIGCFDGVHRGHQTLITMVLQQAKERGLGSMVITFDKQPREVFDPSFRPHLLSTPEEKERLLKAMGIDKVVVLPFTRQLAALSARAFMEQVLRDRYGVRVLITGYDNRFGHNRSEGFDDYVRYGSELDMEVLRGDVARFPDGKQAFSSSAIRRLLAEGRVELMPQCLTRYYALTGIVVAGEHIGHELGFPTANLEPDNASKLIPAAGVYAVWVVMAERRLCGMMNIGMRPTFNGHRQTQEVNVLDFEGNLYGQRLTVEFVARVREERRFDSREALAVQLAEDRKQVEALLISR